MQHSRLAQCDSRQAVQTLTGHSDGVVSAPRGLCTDLPQVAPSQDRPICHQVQQQTASVHVSSPGCKSLGCKHSESVLGNLNLYAFPPIPLLTSVVNKILSHQSQEVDHHSSWLGQHPLVLGSGGIVIQVTLVPAKPSRSPDLAIQWQPTQGSEEAEPSCLASRAKAIWEQGFSDQVAERIEAPQMVYQISLRRKVVCLCSMVQGESSGLPFTIYRTNRRFPPAPILGKNVQVGHY